MLFFDGASIARAHFNQFQGPLITLQCTTPFMQLQVPFYPHPATHISHAHLFGRVSCKHTRLVFIEIWVIINFIMTLIASKQILNALICINVSSGKMRMCKELLWNMQNFTRILDIQIIGLLEVLWLL